MGQSTCFTPRLSPLNGKPVLLGFDGADMSSDAGLTLLREIEQISEDEAERLLRERAPSGTGAT